MPNNPHRPDPDPQETQEWVEALEAVLERDGPERTQFLLDALSDRARQAGTRLPFNANTPYLNSIAPEHEEQRPGDPDMERRIKSIIRWNAMAMVVHANKG